MTNASRISVTADSQLLAAVHSKPRPFLERALKRGLTVWQHTNTSAVRGQGWTIESANPIDDWQLWLYFIPGKRGGRLTITRYYLSAGLGKSVTVKLTQAQARVTIDDMGDALDRHHERQARIDQAEAAMRQLGSELDGAVVPDAPAAPSPTAPSAAVQAVKEVPLSGETSLAKEALVGLKANARFALRAAHRGTIPQNTPTKVRHVLVRRGLADVAGGALTELGREVRKLIIN
jgi:hypothetical protein